MVKSPAFQFYAQDFLVGVLGMTDEEIGVYIKMLAIQWDRGALPADPKAIKTAIGSRKPPSERVLQKFAVGDDGQLRNARLERERDKQAAFRDSRTKAANKRWEKSCTSNARALRSGMQNDALQSSSSSSSSIKGGSPLKPPRGEDALHDVCNARASADAELPPPEPDAKLPDGMISIPVALDTPAFRSAWDAWIRHLRTLLAGRVSQDGLQRCLFSLIEKGPQKAVAMIDNAIANQWRSLQEPKEERRGRVQGAGVTYDPNRDLEPF